MIFAEWCEVFRRGVSTPYLSREKYSLVELKAGGPTDLRSADAGITVSTTIPSKGGGETRLHIFIDAGAYEEIAAKMMQSAPDATLKAFSKAIGDYANEPKFTKRLTIS